MYINHIFSCIRYWLLTRRIKSQESVDITSDSDPLGKVKTELNDREKLYTHLLKNYTFITHLRNILKEAHKWLFFWAICIAGYVMICYICKIMDVVLSTNTIEEFSNTLPIVVASLVSFLSAVIVIPATIVKFLFNEKEDDNITKTISKTQKRDLDEFKYVMGIRPYEAKQGETNNQPNN